MSAEADSAVSALNQRFLLDFPHEAARELESMPFDDAAELLAAQPPRAVIRTWQALAADVAREILERLPDPLGRQVLAESEPANSVAVLGQMDDAERERLLGGLDAEVANELRDLLAYPEDCAGRLMDPRVSPLRAGMDVAGAVVRLRGIRRRGLRELFVIDDEGRLAGRVEIQDLATAAPATPLRDITRGVVAAVQDLAPREEVVDVLQRHPITALPVISHAGRFLGVIRQAELRLGGRGGGQPRHPDHGRCEPRRARAVEPAVRGAQAAALAADQSADGVPRGRGGRACSRAPSPSSPRWPCCCRWWRASRATPARRPWR